MMLYFLKSTEQKIEWHILPFIEKRYFKNRGPNRPLELFLEYLWIVHTHINRLFFIPIMNIGYFQFPKGRNFNDCLFLETIEFSLYFLVATYLSYNLIFIANHCHESIICNFSLNAMALSIHCIRIGIFVHIGILYHSRRNMPKFKNGNILYYSTSIV